MGEKEEMKEMFQELTGFEKKKYKPQDQWGTGQSYADRTGAYNV